MKHTFSRASVQRLLDHTNGATENAPLYEDPDTAVPGLWLVGDEGVYLMSNGKPALPGDPVEGKTASANFVVYAREVDPTTMAFDAWWNAKQMGFGGDDGVDFIAAGDIAAALKAGPDDLVIDLVAGEMTLRNSASVLRQK